mgnify:CR=1 FL=1
MLIGRRGQYNARGHPLSQLWVRRSQKYFVLLFQASSVSSVTAPSSLPWRSSCWSIWSLLTQCFSTLLTNSLRACSVLNRPLTGSGWCSEAVWCWCSSSLPSLCPASAPSSSWSAPCSSPASLLCSLPSFTWGCLTGTQRKRGSKKPTRLSNHSY